MIRIRCVVLAVAALSIPAAVYAKPPAEPDESVSASTAHQPPDTLDTLSQSPAALFESVSPSIVVVYGKDREGRRRSLGSGVVIARGEVATNCHVVGHLATLLVKHRSRYYPATLKDADDERDVCSLTVMGFDAPAVELGETQSIKIGQKVFAISAPYGLELTLSEGLISGLRDVPDGRVLQISAPISPGSSGGGLFDERGRLIGLPTFSLSGGQQLNFAVPVEWVTALPHRSTTMKPAAQRTVALHIKAIGLDGKQDWLGLLQHAQAWTQAQPQEAMAWFWLGVAYKETKEFPKAIEAYREALRIRPDFAQAWTNLGVAYRKANQLPKAIEAHQEALRINPNDAQAWTNLGVAYRKANQLTKAIEAHREALRIRPDFAEAWTNLGVAYDDVKQVTKAIEAYREALRIRPDFVEAWTNLGVVYKRTGQSAKVMEVYTRLKHLDPAKADEFFNTYVLP